jgi:glycosyltransferase involved in cell wall biosynthesis
VGPAHPYRGGQALVESHLFQLLSRLGYDCHTVSFKLLYPSVLFPGTTQFDKSDRLHFDHSDRIHRVINSINPFTWTRAAKKIEDLDPRVVVFVWWMPFFGPALGTIARRVKKRTDAKIVFLVENYVSHENRWFDHFATRKTLRYADQFISESQFVTDRITQDFPETPIEKCTLPVYDCYDFKRFDKSSARAELGIESKNVVLFFGYIRPYKGLHNVINAFGGVLSEHPDTTLLIVGECYEDRKRYDDLLEKNNITDRTMFVSRYVSNEEVEPYFKAADVVCLPYESASQSGIVMMSYGFRRPVVTTEVGGLPEFVRSGETGLTVPPRDPEAIARAVNQILDSLERVDYEAKIAAFTEELGYKRLEKLFQRLIP